MRRTRPLILLLIVLILGSVGLTYYKQKADQARNAPEKPPVLPERVSAQASDWTHSETRDGIPIYHVTAKRFQQDADGGIELADVTLRLFSKDGKTFDEVKSAKADFDVSNGVLFSDGDVQITMGVGADIPPEKLDTGRLVVIKTSGVHFESKSGKAWTEKPASFQFDRGEGKSEGAEYDPNTRELHMRKDGYLKWTDSAKPMEVQAGAIIYKEAESKVWLLDWSKFKRDTLTMDAGASIVTLEEGVIRHVEAANARGNDTGKGRNVHYAANRLDLHFTEKGAIEDVIGDGSAKLVSTSATGETTVTCDRLDLDFEIGVDDAVLKKATGVGKSVIEAKPLPRPDTPLADTRILRSEIVSMYMRPGGEEIERVQAEAPGTIEFLPNRPGQKKRRMQGDSIMIRYGANNQIESFSAVSVTTRTENEPIKGKPQPPAVTSSKGMAAQFEPKSGSLLQIEQWDDFKYQEGERQAKADRAVLEQAKDQITLTGSARVWDPTGSTAAQTIVMMQSPSST
jgi:lipopolysaccharide export system protein LptA